MRASLFVLAAALALSPGRTAEAQHQHGHAELDARSVAQNLSRLSAHLVRTRSCTQVKDEREEAKCKAKRKAYEKSIEMQLGPEDCAGLLAIDYDAARGFASFYNCCAQAQGDFVLRKKGHAFTCADAELRRLALFLMPVTAGEPKVKPEARHQEPDASRPHKQKLEQLEAIYVLEPGQGRASSAELPADFEVHLASAKGRTAKLMFREAKAPPPRSSSGAGRCGKPLGQLQRLPTSYADCVKMLRSHSHFWDDRKCSFVVKQAQYPALFEQCKTNKGYVTAAGPRRSAGGDAKDPCSGRLHCSLEFKK